MELVCLSYERGVVTAGSQSIVPFALRILACELPAKLGRWKDSQDAFYNLLDFCRQRLGSGLPNAGGSLSLLQL